MRFIVFYNLADMISHIMLCCFTYNRLTVVSSSKVNISLGSTETIAALAQSRCQASSQSEQFWQE